MSAYRWRDLMVAGTFSNEDLKKLDALQENAMKTLEQMAYKIIIKKRDE